MLFAASGSARENPYGREFSSTPGRAAPGLMIGIFSLLAAAHAISQPALSTGPIMAYTCSLVASSGMSVARLVGLF